MKYVNYEMLRERLLRLAYEGVPILASDGKRVSIAEYCNTWRVRQVIGHQRTASEEMNDSTGVPWLYFPDSTSKQSDTFVVAVGQSKGTSQAPAVKSVDLPWCEMTPTQQTAAIMKNVDAMESIRPMFNKRMLRFQ